MNVTKTFNDLWQKLKYTGTEKEQKTVKVTDIVSQIISTFVKARINAGLSQADLAAVSGIRKRTIVRMEEIKVMPRLDTLASLAVALGVYIEASLCDDHCIDCRWRGSNTFFGEDGKMVNLCVGCRFNHSPYVSKDANEQQKS